MKSNKSYTKRLRVTKNGKILSRKPGGNHYNAKERREDQLARKTAVLQKLNNKTRGRFLPRSSKGK